MNDSTIAIGEVIRHGVLFDLKNGGKTMADGDALSSAVRRLFRLLDERQIDYVLVGGVALLQYVAGRNTQDIDLIMAPADLARLPEIELAQRDADFARGRFELLQIDILPADNPLFAHIRQTQVTPTPFAEQTIATATVEGLVLLKLYALPSLYRQGDFTRVGLYENDVATLLHAYRPNVAALLDDLAQFVSPADLIEIRAIVTELQGRFARLGE